MLEKSPAKGVYASDRGIIANGEPIQEMEHIDRSICHGNVVSLIAATSNEALTERARGSAGCC
jgi:hypothetical protein